MLRKFGAMLEVVNVAKNIVKATLGIGEMNSINTKYHVHEGRDSGYPWCCIIYFILRGWLFDLTGYLIPLHTKSFQHTACPYHVLVYKLGRYKPRYYTCRTCGWVQLNRRKCNICKDPIKKEKQFVNQLEAWVWFWRNNKVIYNPLGTMYENIRNVPRAKMDKAVSEIENLLKEYL